MTLTMLLASIYGPVSEAANSIVAANILASFVSLTEGRACSPIACNRTTDPWATKSDMIFFLTFASKLNRRQFFSGATYLLDRRSTRGLGRRDYRPFNDGSIAHHHNRAPRF